MDSLRTCIACRKRATRDELLRVVVRNGRLVVDDNAVLPGRGAWVHPTITCLKLAMSRGSFLRALKVSRPLDAETLENRLEKLMDN